MIQLQPQQQEHVARLVNILKHHKCALDLSVMGAGKSYSSAYYKIPSNVASPNSFGGATIHTKL